MNRSAFLERISIGKPNFDIVVIGGGANGAGIALDAAGRGLSVLLLERGDFGCGTSSRSSKLIHGGVRYLALGQFGLVREALAERARLLNNASAIVKPLPFVIPAAGRFELLKFAAGLKLYDWLAQSKRLGSSKTISPVEARALIPGLKPDASIGAACYLDAHFDDARLLIAILQCAVKHGAAVLNYCEVTDLLKGQNGAVRGVNALDPISGQVHEIGARCVINATGPFGDGIRQLDGDMGSFRMVPSQGAHVVVNRRFLGGDHALVLPHTPDGRIMFAIPWANHLMLGTTDTALNEVPLTPRPLEAEITMILDVASEFLDPAPSRADVLSTFAGVRPLVAVPGVGGTAKLSREHAINVSASGLVSVSGGKWTTYRHVAEQCVDVAAQSARIDTGPSVTRDINLARTDSASADRFAVYGEAHRALEDLVIDQPELAEPLHPDLPYCGAHYVWAAREEMALEVFDALAYRTRAMFLNARAATAIAPHVAELMAAEFGYDRSWIESQTAAVNARARAFMLTPTRAHETHG